MANDAGRKRRLFVKPIIQFSHANGFPAPCYRQVLEPLRDAFRVRAVECIGHDPRFPVGEGWTELVQELIVAIESERDGPVIGVGHSLGGYLSALAAASRPDLFRAVILLDAPIIGPFAGSAMQFAKHVGLIDRVTLAGSTKRRRHWPSRTAALAHFHRKALFRRFDPACLSDYIAYGTVEDEHGASLRFDPEVEYRIYRTMPHDMADALENLTVPAGFIGGSESELLRRVGLKHTRLHFLIASTPGGHLFPFQRPEDAARAIRRMAADLGAL